MRIHVENMDGKSGKVVNQFIIWTEDGLYFQSYQTIIAFRPYGGKVQLDKKSGEYELVDLN